MSIVGPRPHMHKDCWEFTKVVKDYKIQKSGKTRNHRYGTGKRIQGPTDTDSSIVMRYNWDIFYVKMQAQHLIGRLFLLLQTKRFFK